MAKVTTKALSTLPSAAAGVSITPSSTAWANSAWVQLTASTSGAIQIEAVTLVAGVTGVEYEVDIGVGGAGSEVVIGTLRGYNNTNTGDGFTHRFPIPLDRIPTTSRVAIRMRKTGTSTVAWTGAVTYFSATDSTDIANTVPTTVPNAGNGASISPNSSAWANSGWTSLGSIGSTDIYLTGFAFKPGTTGVSYEFDFGVGTATGSINTITTLRGQVITAAGDTFQYLPQPLLVHAGQTLWGNLRTSGTGTTAWTGIAAMYQPAQTIRISAGYPRLGPLDYNNSSGSSPVTISSVLAENYPNSMLVVQIGAHQGTISSVTYGGVNLTRAATAATAFNETAELWYLLNPTAGVADVAVNYSSASWVGANAFMLYNVKQNAPYKTGTNNGSSSAASATVTTTSENNILIDAATSEAGFTAPTGWTQDFNLQGQSFENAAGGHQQQYNPGKTTPQWSLSSGQRWSMVVMAVEPMAFGEDSAVTEFLGYPNDLVFVTDSVTVAVSSAFTGLSVVATPDTSTVTESVTMLVKDNVNVFDSSAVTENVTVRLTENINVFDSSTVTENTSVSWPLMQTLVDDFEFGGVDSGKWSIWGSTTTNATTNLLLEMTSTLAANYGGLLSIKGYNLTGSYAFSQLVDAGNQSITSLEVYPVELSSGSNALSVMVSGNTVYARKKISGSYTTVGSSVAYNSTTMKWFRVSESGGTITWAYAADPTSTWTTIATLANPFDVTNLIGGITLGTWQAEGSTTTAKVDNFNVLPGTYQFSWKGYTWNQRLHQGATSTHQQWDPVSVTGPDGSGYLTLALTNPSGNQPIGTEFFSAQRGFGYGTYTSVVGTQLDTMSHKVGWGGLFTFDFTAPPDYKEIDSSEVRDYASQPNIQLLHSHVYNNTGSGTFITDNQDITSDPVQTHRLIWTPTSITFDAFAGTGTGGTLLFHSVHTTNLPTPGLERVHFNLWSNTGVSGWQTASPFSVVLRDFSFAALEQVSVSDSSTVTESVTVALVASTGVSVFDSSAVTESVTMLQKDNISVFDSSAVTESVSVRTNENISVFDSSAITDVLVVPDDTVWVTEYVSVSLAQPVKINVFDSSAVTESVTIQIPVLLLSVSDSSAVTDVPTVVPQIPGISVFDSSAVTESTTVTETDNVSVTDFSGATDTTGYGLYFSGGTTGAGSGRVTLADNAALNSLTALTVEAMVYMTDNSTTLARIVDYQNTTPSQLGFYMWTASSAPFGRIAFGVRAGGVDKNATTSSAISIGQWHHILGSWDGANVRIFVDGVLAGGPTAQAGANTGDPGVSMNIGNGSGSREFPGVLKEIRISNIARQTANFTPPTSEYVSDANTILLYHLDDGSGTTATDSSSNGLNATLTGTPLPQWVTDDSGLNPFAGTVRETDNVSVSDSSTVTDAVTMLEKHNVNVSDSSTVTDVITQMLESISINVFDASAVTDVLVQEDEYAMPFVVDSSTVTDAVIMLVTDFISVSDSSAVTDVVTMLEKANINVSDSSTVTDVLLTAREDDNINVNDTSTVTDAPTVVVPNYYISVFDSSTATDVVIAVNFPINAITFDSSTVTDVPTVRVPIIPLSVFDSSTVTDVPTIGFTNMVATPFDSSAVTDSVTVQTADNINVNDTSAVTDVVTAIRETINISVFDTSLVLDVLTGDEADDNVVAADSTTITEFVSVAPALGGVVVNDTSTVTESVTAVIHYNLAVNDSSSVTESVTGNLSPLFISVGDDSVVTEDVNTARDPNIRVDDSSTVTDSVTVTNPLAGIVVNDTSTVTDVPTVRQTHNVSVSDSSTVTDVLVDEDESYNIVVVEVSAVTDTLTGQNGGIFLNPLDISVYELIGPYKFIFVDGQLAMQLVGNIYTIL